MIIQLLLLWDYVVVDLELMDAVIWRSFLGRRLLNLGLLLPDQGILRLIRQVS